MKRLSRFFILLAVSVSIAACSPPVGYISSKGGLDDMWAVPKRVHYEFNHPFERTDLTVLGMYRGAVEEIPINQVDIYIVENPDGVDEVLFDPKEDLYGWEYSGRKIIVIKYPSEGKVYRYSVEVADALDGPIIPPPGGGPGIYPWWPGDPWPPGAGDPPDPDPDP
jgi:hypothetical protein